MTSFNITANGAFMGTYEGNTESEAVEAYVQDGGYTCVYEAAQSLGLTEEQFRAELTVDASR